MDTKSRILDEALTLFSEKGYANVYVSEIAERVGIKAPSLYKHYESKQAIFDALIREMNSKFLKQADALHIQGDDAARDAAIYKGLTEEQLIQLGKDLFQYFLHDEYTRKFRRMLTMSAYHDKELSEAYMKHYVDDPLSYQGMLLGLMVQEGVLHTENVDIMTLHFYAPIYMLLTSCDRDPDREESAVRILEKHIRQFNRLYGRKTDQP
ncbi:MAG: TetR/AcrR family transcriptional regulator [Clostridia bacterium]|nr:TetR/AcrR family transcriptional regulator [Clostridia bacterium]